MTRDPRYDILFEPVKIGPVTTRNRFVQTPHCTGAGHQYPKTHAAMREVKAEGGWGVVGVEFCSIHCSSDVTPYASAKLWDDDDIRDHALIVEAVHRHEALAAVELMHDGVNVTNRLSRETPLAPSPRPLLEDPWQARAMDKADIRELRRWHQNSAKRAKAAGYDIVYIFCAHSNTLPLDFILRRKNQRTDEYGGNLENRTRLLRELIEDTKEAIGDTCAVAVRFAVDELIGHEGLTREESREIIGMLAELPDLWDVNLADWANDSGPSRFVREGSQEPYVAFVKKVTTKPVVGVGRFTSPDTMVSQIKRGILDLIGAARPSIADPFLPKKIDEGRIDDIRECIGCNICVSGYFGGPPMRCTQNPTMSEEWRRSWHPEKIARKGSDDRVLVVGAGPAGLECAHALGKRGYEVHLAEATTELGGRVAAECRLPGLAEWGRVRDYRTNQIDKISNVKVYRDSHLTAEDVREFGFDHVVIATGAHWRKDGVGRANHFPIKGTDRPNVVTVDEIMAGLEIEGPVVVFDDDYYYIGGVIAEKVRRDGLEVALVTPASDASAWTVNTLEFDQIQTRLRELGIAIITHRNLTAILGGEVELACVYTGRRTRRAATTVIMVTSRLPNDSVYHELAEAPDALAEASIKAVTRIGDCLTPGTIAAAVYSGHRFARELDGPRPGDVPFRLEPVAL